MIEPDGNFLCKRTLSPLDCWLDSDDKQSIPVFSASSYMFKIECVSLVDGILQQFLAKLITELFSSNSSCLLHFTRPEPFNFPQITPLS